jgi:hypothetical protein
MQNLASGTQTSPHFVDDVRLNEHFVFAVDAKPGSKLDGEAIDEGPNKINNNLNNLLYFFAA